MLLYIGGKHCCCKRYHLYLLYHPSPLIPTRQKTSQSKHPKISKKAALCLFLIKCFPKKVVAVLTVPQNCKTFLCWTILSQFPLVSFLLPLYQIYICIVHPINCSPVPFHIDLNYGSKHNRHPTTASLADRSAPFLQTIQRYVPDSTLSSGPVFLLLLQLWVPAGPVPNRRLIEPSRDRDRSTDFFDDKKKRNFKELNPHASLSNGCTPCGIFIFHSNVKILY